MPSGSISVQIVESILTMKLKINNFLRNVVLRVSYLALELHSPEPLLNWKILSLTTKNSWKKHFLLYILPPRSSVVKVYMSAGRCLSLIMVGTSTYDRLQVLYFLKKRCYKERSDHFRFRHKIIKLWTETRYAKRK